MSVDRTVRDGDAAIAAGSKSFAGAAKLFDRRTRESAVMLYAWCRHCDDVVDDQVMGFANAGSGSDPREGLRALEQATRAALAVGDHPHSAFAGLARVATRHDMPAALPLAHLEGFRMDVEGRRYRTLDDTIEYCYHVAGVVGLMMAHVMGVRDPATLDRACDLGIAFQLTNIARDIVPDAECGRVYLPTDWLGEAGIARDEVAHPSRRDAVAVLARRLVHEAEPYYASARLGIRGLPPRSAWAIATARDVYRAIGLKVVSAGPAAWDGRVSTSRGEKLRFALRGAFTALASRSTLRSRSAARCPRSDRLWQRPA